MLRFRRRLPRGCLAATRSVDHCCDVIALFQHPKMRLENGFCRRWNRVLCFGPFYPAIDYFSTCRTARNPAFLGHILVSLKIYSKRHLTILHHAFVSHHESHESTVEHLLETGHSAAFREWRE
jgi:hypothetical protein